MIKGIVRKVDDLGRIVLPKEIRKSLHIKNGDPVDIYLKNGVITMEPCRLQCVCCGNTDEDKLVEKNGVLVCPKCVNDLRQEVMKNE